PSSSQPLAPFSPNGQPPSEAGFHSGRRCSSLGSSSGPSSSSRGSRSGAGWPFDPTGFPPDSRGAPHRCIRGPRPPSAVSFRAAASMGGTSRLRRSPSCVHGFRRLRSRWPVDRAVPRKDPCFDRTHRRVPARGAPGKNLFAHERRRVIGDWEFSAGRVDRGGTMRIGSIVIDCDDFPRMMALWKEALHYVPKYSPDGGWIILKDPEGRGPNLSLNLSSEGHLDEYRLHLDLYAGDQNAESNRLLRLCATLHRSTQPGDY